MTSQPSWTTPFAPSVEVDGLTDDQSELVEKLSLRLVFQALAQFATEAGQIFAQAEDREIEIAQDVTREALDLYGGFPIRQRVFGTVDYKAARWLPTSFGLVPQALFVDSKAERSQSSCTLQMSQISLPVRQWRAGVVTNEQGTLPQTYDFSFGGTVCKGITTVVVVHYRYRISPQEARTLRSICLAAIPNGRLAQQYCPTETDHIWNVGRNAPTREERFRVRVGFKQLERKAAWRVQRLTWVNDSFVSRWQDSDPDGGVTRLAVP